MNILFYRYNSIFEPHCINAFKEFGLNVIEERAEMTNKKTTPGDTVKIVSDLILNQADKGDPFIFVFSINFFPAISDICEKLHTIYACWSVDCPVNELFTKQIKNSFNRVFLFDKTQYDRLYKYNPNGIFYLPLATDVDIMDKAVNEITETDKKKFSSDISFIGSLYSEKNPLNDVKLDDFTTGYIDGLIKSQLLVFGCNFIEDALPDSIVEKIKGKDLSFDSTVTVEPIDKYIAAHSFIGMKIAEEERRITLNYLAKDFNVDLYTLSDTKDLINVNNKGQAKTLTEMPKIFNLSKINLNITMRPIQTGLPLRIFDILGSGGFLITNYQAEIPELFEIGQDLEVYTSLEELHEKCEYYLSHEEERKAIAENGYKKVKAYHTCKARMKTLIELMSNNSK